ncbi:hypothetical protein GCM10010123_01650 [Pilimelia anulata]|uniref:CDP-alcohol phosphatidyltransferase n=2 Tax=Pilimelia anulata TaxID=53371 RepID=A0A8J3B176_9ACTN|nr:hypothetical protein GCM10010123_01650 [Pilimelia anulata]
MAAPGWAQYRAVARPAGLFTVWVDYPVSARLCVAAHRWGLRPSALTLANLVLGVGASLTTVALAEAVAGGTARWWGVVAWLLWQVAYVCDCCDGQLARVTGQSSAAGGRLDVLCDIAVQIALVGAVAAVVSAASSWVPSWLLAVFGASWMVNMVTSVMAKEGTNVSLVTSGSPLVRLVKLVRDYGFMVTLVAVSLVLWPAGMVWVMALFTVVNCGFLAASVAASGRSAWGAGGQGR